jgi:tetratricopeptide (TPR) repeat protein
MKGILAQKMKNHEEALEYLRKAISLNPDDMLAWNAKAVSLYKLQKSQEALASVAHALDILRLKVHNDKIWEVQLLTLKGDFLQDMLLWDEAHEAYDQALKINAESIIPILQKARLFAQSNHLTKMYEYLEKALAIKPILSKELLSDRCFKPFSKETAFQQLIAPYQPLSSTPPPAQ